MQTMALGVRISLVAMLGLFALACSDGQASEGDSDCPGGSGAAGGTANEGGGPDSSAGQGGDSFSGGGEGGEAPMLGASAADFVGSWDGFAEYSNFSDGSRRLRFTWSPDGTGIVVFGDAEPPEEIDVDTFPFYGPNGALGTWDFASGYPYSVLAELEDRRLTLSMDRNSPYREWCEMQLVYPDANNPGEYLCLPPHGNVRFGGGDCGIYALGEGLNEEFFTPVDCGKLGYCEYGGCVCEEDGCTIAAVPDTPIKLWHEDEDTLLGHMGPSFVDAPDVEIRLTRTP
jgi:hypothetical protein